MDWRQFAMDLDALDADDVEQVFLRHGAQSVTLSDARQNPVLEPAPGQTPLWRDTRITGLFPADADLDALRRDLAGSLGDGALPEVEITELEDRAWEREWLRDFAPMSFGERLWVCPTGTRPDAGDAVVVSLDPGLAFGTGTHATTALCLQWLDGLDLDNATMLDYGCGSGILAIAALKLGCQSATAMDIDPQAVTATRRNAQHNDVDARLTVLARDADIEGRFDVVVANILAGPLIELAERIAARVKTGRWLAISGILSEQVGEVRAAYAPWIDFGDPAESEQGGQVWARLAGRRIEG